MALQLSQATDFGIVAPESYAKIQRVVIDSYRQNVVIFVEFFFDQAARHSDKRPMSSSTFDAPLTIPVSDTVIASCYTYLKTLPEFNGAQDV